MTALPPGWAMGAVGLDGSGDFHLAKGVHLRVFTAPELGLPIRPFVVYRLTGREAQERIQHRVRSDIAWIDSRGQVLTPPFAVTPDNPVTGFIPGALGVRCIAVALTTGVVDETQKVLTHRVSFASGKESLVMEAFVHTPEGRRYIGRREHPPYGLAASDIHGVEVRGTGSVRAGLWIEADVAIVDRLQPSFLMDLPVSSASRYEGLDDAETRAIERVRRGAPLRFGLHDDPSVPGPAAAAPASEDDEETRVKELAQELYPHLDQCLNDTSALPKDLGRVQTLGEGVEPGAHAEAEIMSLSAVLTGAADPGLGKWLGFMDVDTDPGALASSMTLYLIRGFLAVDPSTLDIVQLFSLNASGGMLTADLITPLLPFKVPHRSKDDLPVFDFTVAVIVFPGAPPARPAPPIVGAQLSPAVQVGPKGAHPPITADGQGPWLAEAVPPEAIREIVLPLSGLAAAPTLAAAREQSGTLTPLNERHPATDRALALVPAVPDDAVITGTGRLGDRTAPPEAVSYRVAQADWFGRWSEWAFRTVGPKARALPPAPVFEVHYDIAAETPIDDTPRFGTLRVRLTVPRKDDLAPGSRLLVRGKVEGTIDGSTVSASADLTSPTQTHLDIVVSPPAGVIPRAGQVIARVNARWNDGVVDGPPGEPQDHVLVDPRPPAAVTLDPTLRYSARPDAVGRARVVLAWNATAGRRYRVYTTDETRLRGALRQRADAGDGNALSLLQQVQNEANPAVRAQAYTQPPRAPLYTRELFTNLTGQPLSAAVSGPMRFSHDLSGSLSVLAFFKVVAVSASNVESPFTQATLIPIGVPADGPPPRPLLEFLEWTDEGLARLRVTIVRGPQPAAHWRLRRSFASSDDALQMPIVASGPVPEAADEGPVVFEIDDAGTDAIAGGSLRPWTRTTWRVEVQAPNPPGSSMPGEWSPASGPAGGMLVPAAPAPPTDLALDATDPSSGVSLAWKHPEPLRKGSQGGYRFDIYRRTPGSPEARAGTVFADDAGAVTGSGGDRQFHFADGSHPAGTAWRVVVLDPMGRLSPPSSSVTLSETP